MNTKNKQHLGTPSDEPLHDDDYRSGTSGPGLDIRNAFDIGLIQRLTDGQRISFFRPLFVP